MEKRLNIKQLAFCNCYLLRGTGGDCYMEAYGIESKGVAQANASRLLANPVIVEYLQKHRRSVQKKTKVSIERVINELAKIGFSNIQDYITEQNAIADLSKIKRIKAAAVSSVKTKRRVFRKQDEEGNLIETESVEIEFRLHDKIAALDKIGRHLGAFFSIKDLLTNMDEQTAEQLLTELTKRAKNE